MPAQRSPGFFESEPAVRLVGIARLASLGESLDEGHKVEYFSLPAQSLLNKCDTPRMPFAWTINPYRGCEFACKYCYARYTHEFMEMHDGLEFERKIYVKQNAGWLLRRDLKKVKRGQGLAIGTATDPYQPAERRFEMTRSILEELSHHAGLDISIISKSNMILRDMDLFKKIAEQNELSINITVTTTDVELARLLEPRAPRPDLRLDAVRKFNDAGLRAGVAIAPVLPGISDSPKSLDSVVRAAAEAKAQWIFANPLFLKPCSEKVFMPFLAEKFPELLKSYQERYAKNAYLPAAYKKQISTLVGKLKAKYGIREMRTISSATPPHQPLEQQLPLFQ
ncbi:MAG: SPL family radical SAM protein [Terriglobales bacterium]|jgi:DNA repair photolyase